jgi:hypothetical protein
VFDPELWRRTRLSVISLIVIGAVLLLPAGYVFFLAGVLMDAGGVGMVMARPGDALLLIRLGQRNLECARTAARSAEGANLPDSERISEPTP